MLVFMGVVLHLPWTFLLGILKAGAVPKVSQAFGSPKVFPVKKGSLRFPQLPTFHL